MQCISTPNAPSNGGLKCSAGACIASCLPDYRFPNGETSMQIGCVNGRWTVKNFEFNEVPSCEPICMPACLNKGICIAPGECQCPQNFMGPTCQHEKKFCLGSPPLPANARRSCTQTMCTITCMKGYKFPDASLSMNLLCKNGEWMPERANIQTIPDCQPTCDPPCGNGGTCLSYNVCQCGQSFRGAQCQWSVERCSPKKMNFNGGYNCSGSGDAINCKLYCPKGISFDSEPHPVYTCNYGVGEFLPKQVPKCVYGEGMQVIQGEPIGKYEFGQTNGTWRKSSSGKKTLKVIEQDGSDEDEVIEEKTIIKTTIKKKKKKTLMYEEEDDEFFQVPGVYSMYMSQDLEVTYRTPKASVCMTWNGNKLKTFDGVSYNHDLICSHTLVQDRIDGSFNVILRACAHNSVQPCPHALEVFMQSEQFTFESVGGQVKMFTTKKEIPIPVKMPGLKVTRSGLDVRIVLESIPLTITWDSKKFIQVDATPSIWNRTAGLCGTMDSIMSNDFMSKDGTYHKMPSTFVDSWRALNMDKNKEQCAARPMKLVTSACETAIEEKANLVCTDLLKNPKMKNCLKMFNEENLMKNCISDYCDCKNEYERTQCICNGIAVLAKDCRFRGVMLEDEWRDWQICPLNCTNGRVYKSCGPLNEPSCGSAIESDSFNCREGCFCPDGTMLNDGACVKKELCPCTLKGKAFAPKSQIKKDCNTATCVDGAWKYTSQICGARCSAVGDPHYVTFDGKRFDFMGKCSYYLMKTEKMSVEAENVACSGAISESMNFLPSFSTDLPSCTKSLTIKFNDDAGQQRIIKLKQGGFVLLDGFEVAKLPRELSNGGVIIRQVSSSFVVVDFMEGVKVWFDGITRAYIDVEASYRGEKKTQGLCGTFNSNMQDDFLTPEGDVESTVLPFANKWQTKDTCDYQNDNIIPHPCQANVANKAKAEKICSKLRDKVFEECHLFVDPELFYEDCLYDVCACKGDINHCACPILASYAAECARQGNIVEWRYKVTECTINCPNGQVFEQCGEACTRTCSDLQSEAVCKLQCVEGCRCPAGQVLDENNECVLIGMCKCAYKGMEFKSGYKEVRPGRKFQELCTCSNAKWLCVEAKGEDAVRFPAAGDMSKKCSPTRNEVFTTCEPAEPVSCKNMHLNVSYSTASCRPGCRCKDGYVLDTLAKLCVLPENCSCHHGGKSYNDGENIQEDCNTCKCKGGKWDCTKKACASTCSAWGDSHFTTFDGREFDFQGVCSYVLSKGKLQSNSNDGFSVTIQNVLCGSNGVTCSKSLEINLVGNEAESISLSSDLPVPGVKSKPNAKPLKKISVYRSGVFMVVEIPHLGVAIKWDRGTRVYLKLEARWKGKVQGLCGNYNYDALDDFKNPQAGVEMNPIIFGHSWKLDDSCSMPTEQVDSCALNAQRKTWAQRKCGVLKSSVFSSCHSEVSVDSFYKRCIFDTCSCDKGGDCECLCTALGAYAFACSAKGLHIRWRTPDSCPMQCDPTCSNYNPCISSCPAETCDNLMHQNKNERLCNSDNCVEGCKLKECPEGLIYKNDSFSECVPKSVCKPICLELDGIVYYEDDVIASDTCHTCKCSRGKKVCSGTPCATDSPLPDSRDGDVGCTTGWTNWINADVLNQAPMQGVKTSKSNYFKEDDVEPLPTSLQIKNVAGPGFAVCGSNYYASIECRTVVDHKTPKQTGQNVECSLERGLVCKGQCFDFEIRIYCECGDSTSPKPQITTRSPEKRTTFPIIAIPIVPIAVVKKPTYIKICDPNVPNVEHPLSCSKFLQCVMAQNGTFIYAEKTCGDSMMFNPKAMVCDWPASVKAIKPKCGTTPEEIVKPQCPPNYVWSECAIPCNRACNYYGKQLRLAGNCTSASNDCLSGCLPLGSAVTCDYPKVWRDWKSCVELASCTCVGPNNEQLKPGQVIKISECQTCQCINNEYICADTPCARETIRKQVVTPKPGGKTQIITEEETIIEQIFTPEYITVCDPSVPHVEHPNSCYKFLHCQPARDGSWVYAVKTCYPDMMFNPQSMICDWPASVKAIKPNCGINPGEIEIWELKTKQVITSPRPGTTSSSRVTPRVTEKPLKIVSVPSKPQFVVEPTTGEVGYGSERIPHYIRICNPNVPHIEHPNSCYKFLHCQQAANGSWVYAVKTCYPDMMYNPQAMVCDWPASVKAMKPSCGVNPGEIEIWELKVIEKIITQRPGTVTEKTLKIVSSSPRPQYVIETEDKDVVDYAGGRIPHYIRICNPSVPHIEHPNSCYKFLHCQQAANGSWVYAVKTCYPDMMYNPQAMVCDWPASVKAMKPSCGVNPGEIEIWELKVIEQVITSRPGTTSSSRVTPRVTEKPLKIVSVPSKPQFVVEPTTGEVGYAGGRIPHYIRICDPSVPHIEHPNSCYKFLHCQPAPNGSWVYVVKTCYPDTMFNPQSMICDWPASVAAIKPNCGVNPGEIEIWEYISTERPLQSLTSPGSRTSPSPRVTPGIKIVPDTRTSPKPFATDKPTKKPQFFVETTQPEVIAFAEDKVPYFIRICDPRVPQVEHPESCYKFLLCQKSPNGTFVYAEKSCGDNLMFNPQIKDCDWPPNVQKIKPVCGKGLEILNQVTSRKPEQITTTTTTSTPLLPVIIVQSTVTPPSFCDQTKLVPLLPLLPDSAFTASSSLGPAFMPEAARLDSKSNGDSAGSWVSKTNDLNQYLQIEFPQSIPVYGVIVRGSPILDQYVTSFKILHSFDGQTFHVLDDTNNRPQIFSGSVDPRTPVKSMFKVPVEAKLIRIYPISWNGNIALRTELLGCQKTTYPITFGPVLTTTTRKPIIAVTQPQLFAEITTTVISIIVPEKPMCDDPLGVENSQISPNQITFSSIKDSGSVKTKVRKNPLEIIKLQSPRGWMPLTDNVNEFVMFDFLGNRNLTGVVTKGGEYGWVKSFNVLFSKDNVIWNKVVDETGRPQEFIANVDAYTPKKNLFRQPINAQYLKIQPTKWHSTIEMKLEPLGCFKPYPKRPETTVGPNESLEIITSSSCGMCKDVLAPRQPLDENSCVCYPPLYWSGTECVPQTQCPCVEGHMNYGVGETYQTESCSDCLCKIGGIPQCTPKVCTPCVKGQRRTSPQTCSCKCEKCPPETVLCQTSGQCIPESAWCDGIQDCPDDEVSCLATIAPYIKEVTNITTTIIKKCPDPVCPPGFRIKQKEKGRGSRMMSRFSSGSDEDEDDKPQHQYYYIKAKYQASYEAILPISTNSKQQDVNAEECFEFVCLPLVEEGSEDYVDGRVDPKKCPEPKCPRGYMIRLSLVKAANECAKFSCEPAIEDDAICNVTGRTFTTFDKTEFKYDICAHLLARDVADAKWNVIMRKNCSTGNNVCMKEVEIKDKVAKYTLILYPTLNVNLDGYYFTVEQLQNSNRKMSFVVSKNGDNLLYVSHTHGIWLRLDQYGDVKLGIASQYAKQVDGLCGFFNNDKSDDKRTPSGKLSDSSVEFGDSWSLKSKEDCEPHVCPRALQEAALTMCNLVKDDIFKPCAASIDPNRFISKCLETACECLLTASNGTTSIQPNDLKLCKCSMLKNYVVECLAADENVHLETWRSVQSCEATCIAPLVHRDCYRRKCETTCNNLQTAECTNVVGTCFSGCYCPEGTVKKDSTCVPISECRDCTCDGFGKSQYLTYDRKNFTFDGNCTYLLTRDISLKNVHTFQVYATIGPCDPTATKSNKKATCTQAFHLVYDSHIVHIQKGLAQSLDIIVNGIKLKSLPYNQNWIKIAEQGKKLNILLPESQVELVTMFEDMSFAIKVPSVKYGNKMEGICGNCNGNPNDDLITNPAVQNLPKTNSPMKNFALSWMADEPKLALKEDKSKCHIDDETECLPLPPETDPCFRILDEEVFGKCYMVVDPIMYVTACQQDLCKTGPSQKGACESLAAYARECARKGVCVDWRRSGICNMECSSPFVYNPCGCAETCQSIQTREDLIKKSTAIKDPKDIANMRSICSVSLSEGCFCPKGRVLYNGKCLSEAECRACDDKGHLPGDTWHPDICTTCSCRNDSTIQCQKIQCPAQQTICSLGYVAIETPSTGECCKKYACVAEPSKSIKQSCPALVLPNCGTDQMNKIINGTDGCSKYICDCVPKYQCKPVQNYTSLERGFKKVIETNGCCPVAKLVCDKSLCSPKPSQCTEAFYVVEHLKVANDNVCCDEYQCRPPPNNCVATVGGKKILKKMDDVWPTENVCEKASCAFDTNGNPIIKTQREVCNAICQAGYELKPIPNKCCGECIKTKCVVDNKLYSIGEEWSSVDNCTQFACNIKDGQTFISTMAPTCPDISTCSPAQRYNDGCCEKCKLEALTQHNCLPASLAESQTVGLIRIQIPGHGTCKNVNAVRGITQCSGTCSSGTKFDPSTLHQIKNCDCCSVSGVKEIPVELTCDDKFKLIKLFNVPTSCSCSKCASDDEILKRTKAAF